MKFSDQRFLTEHILTTMGFYHPRCIDTQHGGFFHHFHDDSTVYDAATRHLVSSTRFIFNYAMASVHFTNPEYRRALEHGLAFVQEAHWQPDTQGYAWTLKYREPDDKTNHCYGLAFVLLAYASAVKAGIDSARTALYDTYELLENRFWLPEHKLYADEATADWLIPRAEALFAKALGAAWDAEFGGICYGFAPDGSICDGDKYFWVQAESFAAAALLAVKTNNPSYWDWYQCIWEYAWEHMVDHRYGAWYRILSRDNQKYNDLKSPAGKTDYHTMGACYEVLRWLPS